MTNEPVDSAILIEQAQAGNRRALSVLLDRYRARLRRMVEIRLDTRLQARRLIDAAFPSNAQGMWWDWLAADLLAREATALIEGPGAVTP